jgi:hypothetical protein
VGRLFARETLKFNGKPPPEVRLYMGQVGGVLVPIGESHSSIPLTSAIGLIH